MKQASERTDLQFRDLVDGVIDLADAVELDDVRVVQRAAKKNEDNDKTRYIDLTGLRSA